RMPDLAPSDRSVHAALLAEAQRLHLIGVAGAAMRSLATLLLDLRREVSGSDTAAAPMLDDLVARGVRLEHEHRAEHVAGADLVVVSAAIPEENPELQAARGQG